MSSAKHNEPASFLSFRIGTELFGASVKNVISILEMTKITKVPKAPEYMKGVLNLRGNVLPVIDARIKFQIDNTAITENTCILVMQIGGKSESLLIGAIVDSVQEVLQINEDDIQPPPSIGANYQNQFIHGMVKSKDEFIMLLNVNKLFSEESFLEQQEIQT
ncbi:MAG TPA: chemotaxis protein CheW [Bacteroidales bacterium]|jgi:purine-binding chemotaxis protein CheW|nr:chemotaxis protein CheW [Bacteroidales bacterium]